MTGTPRLSALAVEILLERYLLKNEQGQVIETPEELVARVAGQVCEVDHPRVNSERFSVCKADVVEMLSNLAFLPNSPTLMNAGTKMGQLSACFVLPVPDSIEGIFDAVKSMAQIHKSGGGTGFSFSSLRPKGDLIQSTMSTSSGPLSFMNVFDVTTNAITQGGRRRGANMGILDVDHPDIEEFIKAKATSTMLQNFNLSVAITDEFMQAVEENREFNLVNPRTGRVSRRVHAPALFHAMAGAAWASGDPGVIFIDEINRKNPTPSLGLIKTTNPCGEIPLYSFESCNLGSINLVKVVQDGNVDWDALRRLVITSTRFLDNVIDASKFPLPEIEAATKVNRKIGLGIMGFADMLLLLGIRYDDPRAIETGEKVMQFIQDEARHASVELGVEKGSFPNFVHSIYKDDVPAMRNATRTAIAPTGTISLIADVSSGIEPVFSAVHQREIIGIGTRAHVHPVIATMLEARGIEPGPVIERVKQSRTIDVAGMPGDCKDVFVTALEVEPAWHVKMQAAFQHHVDNSVSKTVNMPGAATIEDVERVFMLAWKLQTKGVTVFRHGSRKEVVTLE